MQEITRTLVERGQLEFIGGGESANNQVKLDLVSLKLGWKTRDLSSL